MLLIMFFGVFGWLKPIMLILSLNDKFMLVIDNQSFASIYAEIIIELAVGDRLEQNAPYFRS